MPEKKYSKTQKELEPSVLLTTIFSNPLRFEMHLCDPILSTLVNKYFRKLFFTFIDVKKSLNL